MRHIPSVVMLLPLAVALSCAPAADGDTGSESVPALAYETVDVFEGDEVIRIGSPQAVAIGFDGTAYVADTAPGRIVAFDRSGKPQEFQAPPNTAFFPTDVAVSGFFIYAIDEPARRLVRFDRSGTFRDVLIDFESFSGRRVSPYGLDVETSGRMAVTDVENHRVFVIDTFLQVELEFGNYGSFDGQFDTPEGVAFATDGGIVVADSGNRRVSVFSRGGTFVRQIPAKDTPSPLRRPRRVALDGARVYVADPAAGHVFVFDATGGLVGSVDATKRPQDIAVSKSGLLLVPDTSSGGLHFLKGK